MRAAAELRRSLNIDRSLPICAYDVAAQLGVEVIFRAWPRLEGFYIKRNPGTIIVGALRPPGRRRLSCAHELGHHVFGHGISYDEYQGDLLNAPETVAGSDEELLADRFASHFLMPVSAIRRAFDARGWNYRKPTPEQIYVVAGYLGVGYSTLLTHMGVTTLIPRSVAQVLLRETPKSIRETLVPQASGQVVIADDAWVGRAIDLEVGDHVILPGAARVERNHLSICETTEGHLLAVATRSGITRAVTIDGWSAFIRIAPRVFAGRSIFRHEEADDADE